MDNNFQFHIKNLEKAKSDQTTYTKNIRYIQIGTNFYDNNIKQFEALKLKCNETISLVSYYLEHYEPCCIRTNY